MDARPSSRRVQGLMHAFAFAWGLAEATVFFIVPDVLLTWVALADGRRALRACLSAVAGALLGGLIMFQWGARDFDAAARVVDAAPAVSATMIDDVRGQLSTGGVGTLFLGPMSATPYKVYAIVAGDTGQSLMLFLLVSIPARLIRFVLLTLLAWAISRGLSKRLDLRRRRMIHAACWSCFYLVFFAFMAE